MLEQAAALLYICTSIVLKGTHWRERLQGDECRLVKAHYRQVIIIKNHNGCGNGQASMPKG